MLEGKNDNEPHVFIHKQVFCFPCSSQVFHCNKGTVSEHKRICSSIFIIFHFLDNKSTYWAHHPSTSDISTKTCTTLKPRPASFKNRHIFWVFSFFCYDLLISIYLNWFSDNKNQSPSIWANHPESIIHSR